MAKLKDIAAFLDRELKNSDFEDSSNNGLQVENSGAVKRVCCGVDASLEFFREAQRRKADLVVCHHGMSWRDSLKYLTGINYRRVSFLIQHDMALYASHLPLDAHPVLGNNALICKALGLKKRRPFGLYNGRLVGFAGQLPRPMRYETFKNLVRRKIGSELRTMDFGRKTIRTVAVISGGAPAEIAEAGEKGIDVYLSGEPALSAYHLAQEHGINAVFAGHYATERFGVSALGDAIGKKFGIPAEFIDLNVPF